MATIMTQPLNKTDTRKVLVTEQEAKRMEERTLRRFLEGVAARHPDPDLIVFVCIGTDRSTGDAFGPLVGSRLKQRGFPHVIGTLEKPCDAYAVEGSLEETFRLRSEGRTVIAVDACLGKPQSVGSYAASEGPLQPGAATGRKLPPVGDYSIAGIVNEYGVKSKSYWKLQTTSLHLVMRMADETADEMAAAWKMEKRRPLPNKEECCK